MKFVVIDQVVLSRPTEGPLAAYLVSFAESLRVQGYCLYSLKRQVRLAACFSRWLKQTHVEVRSICSDHVVRYLRYRARHVQLCRGDSAALTHFIDWLRHQGVIPAEKKSIPRLTSAERCAQAYEQYLREARALAKATILNYVPFIRNFLNDRFGDRRATLSQLCVPTMSCNLYSAKCRTSI